VLAALDERVALGPGETVELHAGSEYRDWGLVAGLVGQGVHVSIPTEGMPLGRQVALVGGRPAAVRVREQLLDGFYDVLDALSQRCHARRPRDPPPLPA
jgi:hypothetical protein